MEHVIHDFQTFLAVQGSSCNAQALEIVHQINFNALQTGLGFLDIGCVDTEGDVLRLHQTIIAFGQLILKHFCVFFADIIKTVIPVRDNDRLLKVFSAGCQVQK